MYTCVYIDTMVTKGKFSLELDALHMLKERREKHFVVISCECMSKNGIFVWQIAQLQSRIHLCLITSLMCERYVDWHK